MEKIEGINLDEIVGKTERELLDEKKSVVQKIVQGVFSDILRWENEIKMLSNQKTKLEERLSKAKQKLDQIKGGDWSVIQEQRPEKEESK